MMDTLDQIAAEATQLEKDQEATQAAFENPDEQAAPAIDPAQAWAALPKMFGGILSMAFPELGKVYTDDRCYQWGAAMQQMADKYGWDAGETMARFAPEIALTMATLPLAVPTIAVIKKAADAKKKREPIDGENLVKPADKPEPTEGAHVAE